MHSKVSIPAPVPGTYTKVADSTQLELCVTVLYCVRYCDGSVPHSTRAAEIKCKRIGLDR
jgi:hypothetical protein